MSLQAPHGIQMCAIWRPVFWLNACNAEVLNQRSVVGHVLTVGISSCLSSTSTTTL